MADPCTTCNNTEAINVLSSKQQNGIYVLQPSYQTLIDGNVVNNPCYNAVSGISTWTYRFFIDCSIEKSSSPINCILIPVCANIKRSEIAVEEKIDSYGRFSIIPFTLSTNHESFGPPPSGFQWLIIENNNRYSKGMFIEYRISIEGNFPVSMQSVFIKSDQNCLIFKSQKEGFMVPGCPIPDRLEIDIKCDTKVQDNVPTLSYNINIQNKGASTLTNVQFQDILNFDGISLILGTVSIPQDKIIQVSSIVPNTEIISGKIDSIAPQEIISINYSVPIASFKQPGTFIFTSIASAESLTAKASNTCTTAIEVVRLKADKYFIASEGNEASSYTVITNTNASSSTNISIDEEMVIPSEVTIQFTDFSSCTAVFSNGNPVPLYTNITNTTIYITNKNLLIPAGGGVKLPIIFKIISTSAFKSPAKITSILKSINGTNPTQFYLSPINVPSSATLDISGKVK